MAEAETELIRSAEGDPGAGGAHAAVRGVRPARGPGDDPVRGRGMDAADFAAMLLRMYLRWAERHGYPTEVYDTSYAEEAGIKSATFTVRAPFAYGTLSVEQGTHRLVRISPFDNQGRRRPPSPGSRCCR